jgi:hypothetical protein
MRDTHPQTPPVPFDAHLHLSERYVRKLLILKNIAFLILRLSDNPRSFPYDFRLVRRSRSRRDSPINES